MCYGEIEGVFMIKFDLHVHSKGSSNCAQADEKTIIYDYKNAGYGGIVITNHFSAPKFKNFMLGETYIDKVDYFLSLFERVKKEGEKNGIKVLCGVEIEDNLGVEYILVGFEKSFLYSEKPLYEFSQQELYNMCDKKGIFMYQTHPFRNGVTCGNPKYMHGVEAFNGHFHHLNNNEYAKAFAENNNLIKLAGIDYHQPCQPLTAYTLVPETVNDEVSLAKYLFSGQAKYVGNELYYITEAKKFLGIK